MSKPRVYIKRDQNGIVKQAIIGNAKFSDCFSHLPTTSREFTSSKQLCFAMLQRGTSQRLFNAAWRKAVACGAVDPSHTFKNGDSLDVQTIEYTRQEAEQVDSFISELVNNPNSKFYIYG